MPRGTRARGRGLSLLTRFGLISLVGFVVIGVLLGALTRSIIAERTEADARRSAVVATKVGIQPLFRPADLSRDFVPLEPERKAQLDRALQGSLSEAGVVRFKVWNRQHWIVWSDNSQLVGRWFPGDEIVEGSFDGDVTTEVTDLRDPDEFEERSFGQLLAVYVPLRAEPGADGFTDDPAAPVVGSFEVYVPYAPIAATIERDTRRIHLALAVGLLLLYLALFRVVATASRRLRRQAEENLHQARHDALTGLPNRVAFRDRLADALGAGPLAVVLLDLDRFKEVNDTLGHHHGDELLVQVGRRLAEASATAADGSSVARLGGDEFAVLLPGVAEPERAVAAVRDLLAVLDAPVEVDGFSLDVHGSAGIALAPLHGTDPDELLQHADVAMYLAKADRAIVELYDAERDTYSSRRLALAHQVRRAIDEGELVVHYQPKLALATMRVTGVEALVRWQHPELGLIPPGEFMPVVETTSLITPLTEHVLDEALRQCRAWRDAGLDLRVSVNLSASSVLDTALATTVADALDRHAVPARSLVLELTETTLVANPERAAEVLLRLSALGVHLSVDDFGTGYASLSYLRDLPVDELKIDRSFVSGLADGGQAAVIVRFSIELARSLGLAVVAEGIEDMDVLDLLVELGCDEAQGYLVARPGPPDEVAEVVRGFDALSPATVSRPTPTATPTASQGPSPASPSGRAATPPAGPGERAPVVAVPDDPWSLSRPYVGSHR